MQAPLPRQGGWCEQWLIGKVPSAGKYWGQKRVSKDKMAGWHDRCNEHELRQIPGDGEGQGGQVCCSLWVCKGLDTTGRLNNNNHILLNLPPRRPGSPPHAHFPLPPEWKCDQGWPRVLLLWQKASHIWFTYFKSFALYHGLIRYNCYHFMCVETESGVPSSGHLSTWQLSPALTVTCYYHLMSFCPHYIF